MNCITIRDLLELSFLSDIVLSPGGDYTAYTITRQNEKTNSYNTCLHLYDNNAGTSRQLTYAGQESACVWESRTSLIFQASRTEEDKPSDFEQKTCYYRLDIMGGEAKKAFEIPLSVSRIQPLGGGKWICAAAVDLNRPPDGSPDEEKEDYGDYHVLEELPFWANGQGYVSRVRNALFLFDEAANESKKLTSEFFHTSSFDVRDGRILYAGCEYEHKRTLQGEVHLLDMQTGTDDVIVEPGKFGTGTCLLTDTGAVLLLNSYEPYGLCQEPDIYRYCFEDGSLTNVSNTETHFGSSILTDASYGGGLSAKAVASDVLFVVQDAYNAQIYTLKADNTLTLTVPFSGNILCIDANSDTIVFAASPPNGCADLYIAQAGKAEKKTDVNAGFFTDRHVSPAKYLPFTDSDGIEIDGWVVEPYGYDPEKSWPGVLEIHGGPRAAFSEVFFHEIQALAGAGYFVFFCNPRGSSGKGEQFADLRGKYGTIDYQDLMEFTDHVLKNYPSLDKTRLAAAGGSYGGFMCNWIESHTGRFAAIASMRSISNWVADFGASEIGYTFDQNEMGATPWTDMNKMWDQSPLKDADKATTPILFIHSIQDYNCPLDQGIEMFTAMKYFDVPARMVLFEGENHSLSRSGKPRHRIRRLKEIFGWFDKYLKAGF